MISKVSDSSRLRDTPVYTYKMDKVLETKKLPIIANKIEGFPRDKVFYLVVEDNEMIGFKMSRGDVALSYATHEIEKDSICLVEYRGKRTVRQVKILDEGKLLLVSNEGRLSAETVYKKDVKILARLIRLEIKL